MPLDAGTQLGPYEVLAPIGQGGMGEVYRARDTRLDRTVAIKVLPGALAADPELRARFEREARAISSLQHPHICALFDVGTAPGPDAVPIQFLVLEHLEGETLAARIAAHGALAVDDALRIAIDVCDAMDKAHRSGIVHRDLKPANVFLVRTARSGPPLAKLLDFGLAKPATPVVATSGLSLLPTTPPSLTAQGTILGTFQYMAPEQIEGLEADTRTDIFAFGALLFEMLTGRTAFEGKTRATLLGAILKDEPPPVSSLRPDVPKGLDRIVATCLAKEPDDRWQSARDLLREMKWASTPDHAAAVAPAAPRRSRHGELWRVLAAVALTAALVGFAAWRLLQPPAPQLVELTIPPPDSATFATPPGGGTGVATQLAVSPDGKHIAFIALQDRNYQVWLRSLASADMKPLPGTEGGTYPFWSPDSRTVAFFADGKLKKVAIGGGPAVAICDATSARGGTWNADNVIVFTPGTGGPLQRVAAGGGTPVDVTTIDAEYGETNHRFPQFLPDGRHFLFVATVGTCCPATKPARVKVATLDGGAATPLLEVESMALYSRGHLLFNRHGTLMAQPFDARSRTLTGDPIPIVENIGSEGSRYFSGSVSGTGVLGYTIGSARPMGTLTWFDRSGKALGTIGEANMFLNASLAPDGRRVAAAFASAGAVNRDIWLYDAAAGTPARFTFDAAEDNSPVWSPDSQRLAFLNFAAAATIRQKDVNALTRDEPLLELPGGSGVATPSDWSPDGRYLLYTRADVAAATATDIWVLPVTGDRKPYAYIDSPAPESDAAFSPDQRWVVYQALEAGRTQIYVQPFPATGRKFQVSRDGGVKPVWRRDGKELFFLEISGRMMSVAVEYANREFRAGVPQPLFAVPVVGFGASGRQFDVTRDGQRFIMNVRAQRTISEPITVVTDWLARLQR